MNRRQWLAIFVAICCLNPNMALPSDATATAPRTFENPATPTQLNAFLNKYAGRFLLTSFFPVVGDIFQAEDRDASWAAPWEQEIRRAAAQIEGFELIDGDCRSSLCRFDVSFKNSRDGGPLDLVSQVVHSRVGTDGVVGFYSPATNGHATIIFFSLRPPAGYVRPMQEKFGVCRPKSCW